VNNLEMVNENMMFVIYFHFLGNLAQKKVLKIIIATSLKINL